MRAVVAVLDSFGIGAADDAARFGDAGANTFGHIVEACAAGKGDRAGLREGPLNIPNLLALGLGEAARAAGTELPLERASAPKSKYGYAAERSRGKDTP
ncbi:MAG: phosphopentomutase, partial [Alphaproteobacteria bacterium]